MGKPVREAFGNATTASGLVPFYAEAVDKIAGDVYTSDKHSFVVQRRTPRGVVAAVVPWNFPTPSCRSRRSKTRARRSGSRTGQRTVWLPTCGHRSLGTAMRMMKGIRSSVFVNTAAPLGEGAGHASSVEPNAQSGVGTKGGLAGMETYLRRQLICFNSG